MNVREKIQATGIRRAGGPRNGFRYRRVHGGKISKSELQRIALLKIPVQWTEVSIALEPDAAVQAVGKDTAGRWQYLYRVGHARRRSLAKFERLLAFARALPDLRRALARDLRRRGLPRDKVLACAVAIMATCCLRPGSEEYADENGTFGLATLRRRHVAVSGTRLRFDYRGKHGVRQRHEIASPRLARIVAEMLRLPGPAAFQYRDESGDACGVSRWQLNQYVKRAMGMRFSAKDFRTWAATWICAEALSRRRRAAHDRASRERAIVDAVRETATYLGNTPRVCQRSYVHPAVLESFRNGQTVRCALPLPEEVLARRGTGLDRPERALLDLLETGRGGQKR